jgi:hypothetical protein
VQGAPCGTVLRKHALRAHEATCELRPASCAACGVVLRAADLASHNADTCPEVKTLCGYAGCGVSVRRKDKRIHDMACWERHLSGEAAARMALDPALADAANLSASVKKRLDALGRAATAATAVEAMRALSFMAVSVEGASLIFRKGIPAALTAHATHAAASPDAAAAACALLARLVPLLSDGALAARAVRTGVDTIVHHAAGSTAAAACASDLLAALCEQPAYLPSARDGNAVNAVIAAARAQPTHVGTVRAACRVVHIVMHEYTDLLDDDNMCTGAVEISYAALATALRAEGDPSALKPAPAAALAEASAAALATLAAGRGFEAARDAGALAAALAALQRWRLHPSVERHALRGIMNFHSVPAARDALETGGGVRTVLSALHRNAASPEALQPALLTLALYGGRSPREAAPWLAGGGADAALRAMDEFPRDALLLEAAASALAALAWPCPAAHGLELAPAGANGKAAGAGAGAAAAGAVAGAPAEAAPAAAPAPGGDSLAAPGVEASQPYPAAQMRIIAAGGGERLAAACASARAVGSAPAASAVARAVRALARACPAGRTTLLAHGAANELLLLLSGAGDLTPTDDARDAAAWCLWTLRELLADGGTSVPPDFIVADARAAVRAAAAPFAPDAAVGVGEAALLRVLDAAAGAAADVAVRAAAAGFGVLLPPAHAS